MRFSRGRLAIQLTGLLAPCPGGVLMTGGRFEAIGAVRCTLLGKSQSPVRDHSQNNQVLTPKMAPPPRRFVTKQKRPSHCHMNLWLRLIAILMCQ